MKKNKIIFCIIVIIIALTPIFVNFILSREIIFNYKVVGSGEAWVNFYGSFLGSGLSTIIAYYILLKTIDSEKNINIKKQKIKEFENLRNDLSERISKIELTDVFRVFLYREQFDAKEELDRLMSLLYIYKAMANSALLRYGLSENDEESIKFYKEYSSLLKDICVAINKMMGIIAKYQIKKDPESLASELLTMKSVMIELNKRPVLVMESAKLYCKVKQKELEDI